MTNTPTDAAIIERSFGEPEFFAAIFDRHAAPVHGYLARRAGRDVADDLVGEVFRVAFEARTRYRTDRPHSLPWLYGIAANVLRQSRRTENRQTRVATKLATSPMPRHRSDDPEDLVFVRDELELALDAVFALRDADRETVLLYAWEELTYHEIAEALGIPPGTVRSRLNRARAQIREQLNTIGQVRGEPTRRADGGFQGG